MQHFFGNSELNNSVDEVLEKALERDREVLQQIKQERGLKRRQRWQKRSKLWPFKARLIRLRREGYSFSYLLDMLDREHRVVVDRSTLSRQLKAWFEEEEEKKKEIEKTKIIGES